MKKMIFIDPRKCTGCKTCEMVCSFANEQKFSFEKSRIRNQGDPKDAFFLSTTCLQCEDAPCARVCPAEALTNVDGVIKVDAARCFGCKICMLACPFGNIRFDREAGTSVKCELCGGDPQCVAFCPTGALQFCEIREVDGKKLADLFNVLKQIWR
jgi:carbon-monoxide dehydrogenase iron sulfur subunit